MTKLEQILINIKTPSYVLDLDRVRSNIRIIKSSIHYPNFDIFYVFKRGYAS